MADFTMARSQSRESLDDECHEGTEMIENNMFEEYMDAPRYHNFMSSSETSKNPLNYYKPS